MIARQSLLILANRIVLQAFGYFSLVLTVRYMHKDSYGMYAFALGLIGVFSAFQNLGFAAAHIKRVSEGYDERRANATYLMLRTGLTGWFALLLTMAYLAWTRLLGQTITEATTLGALVLVGATMTIQSIRRFFESTFQAHRHVAAGQSVLLVNSLVTIVAFPTASLIWRHANGGWVPFAGWAEFWGGTLGITGPLSLDDGAFLLAAVLLLGQVVSLVWAGAVFVLMRYPVGSPSRQAVADYTRYAWPLALVAILSVLATNVGIVLLGYFGVRTDVADFKVSLQLLAPTVVVGQAVATILFPALSKAHSGGRPHEASELVGTAERYISMTTMAFVVLAVVFTREGLHVTSGDQYLSATYTLQALAFYVLMLSLRQPVQSYFMGFGQTTILARNGLVTLVLLVVLTVVLVPKSILGVTLFGLGATGAALASVAAFVVGYLLLKSTARRQLGVGWLPPDWPRHAAAAALTAVLVWSAKTWLGPGWSDRVWELMGWAVLTLAIYLSALVLLRAFGRRDWRFLMDVLNPSKMRSYVWSEMAERSRED